MSSHASSLLRTLRAPASVLWIVDELEKAGHEAWAVGGAVRDRLLGFDGGDWDLATSARPNEVQRVFRRTIPIGIEHGTVGVLDRERRLFEVTTFRKDVLPLGRKAIVEFAESIEDDLSRRDFTINAVAWHPRKLTARDPFAGIADIAAGRLRCVGTPAERFREDHLRILRGLRFAGRFGLEIDPTTWDAMVRERAHVRALSAERVHEELFKVVTKDPRPSRALGLYRATGVWAELWPEHEAALKEMPSDAWGDALATCDRLSRRDPVRRLAPLVAPLSRWGGADALATVLKRLRFSNSDVDRLVHLTSVWERGLPAEEGEAVRRWLHHAGGQWRSAAVIELAAARREADRTGRVAGDVVETLRALRREIHAGVPLQIGDLAIDGGDLKAAGMKPGPRFGEVLGLLLEGVLVDPTQNTPEALLARVREWRKQDGRERGSTRSGGAPA